jgi:hypothetical protein
MLWQLLARRAGLPEDSSPQDILQTAGAADPNLQLAINLMAQRQQQSDSEAASVDEEEEEAVDPDLLDVEEPGENSAIAEVLALRQRCDMLALGLGACVLCWGEAGDCPHCAGAGIPGWRRPEPPAFRQYVAPAVRRWMGRHTTEPQPKPKSRPNRKDQNNG